MFHLANRADGHESAVRFFFFFCYLSPQKKKRIIFPFLDYFARDFRASGEGETRTASSRGSGCDGEEEDWNRLYLLRYRYAISRLSSGLPIQRDGFVLVSMFCFEKSLGDLRAYRRRISAMVSRKEIGVVAFAMISLLNSMYDRSIVTVM